MAFQIGKQLTGIHPRSLQLIEATMDFERERATLQRVKEVTESDVEAVVNLQCRGSFSAVIEGLLRWQDLFRPFAKNVDGVGVGALTRYFETNTFFKRPVILGEIETSGEFIERYFFIDLLPRKVKWKAILPGLLTFAELCENRYYHRYEDLLFALAEALASCTDALSRCGFSFIQFSEPSAVFRELEAYKLEWINQGYKEIVKHSKAKTCVHTFFGDFSINWRVLVELPVDFIGIDFTETSLESLKGVSLGKGLLAGVVDAKNSLLESPKDIAAFLLKAIEYLEPEETVLCPNLCLEHLPYQIAEQKIVSMVEAVNELEEST